VDDELCTFRVDQTQSPQSIPQDTGERRAVTEEAGLLEPSAALNITHNSSAATSQASFKMTSAQTSSMAPINTATTKPDLTEIQTKNDTAPKAPGTAKGYSRGQNASPNKFQNQDISEQINARPKHLRSGGSADYAAANQATDRSSYSTLKDIPGPS